MQGGRGLQGTSWQSSPSGEREQNRPVPRLRQEGVATSHQQPCGHSLALALGLGLLCSLWPGLQRGRPYPALPPRLHSISALTLTLEKGSSDLMMTTRAYCFIPDVQTSEWGWLDLFFPPSPLFSSLSLLINLCQSSSQWEGS